MGLFDRFERAGAQRVAAAVVGHEPGSIEAIAEANTALVRRLRRDSGRIPPRAYVLARTITRHLDDVVTDPSGRLMDVGSRIGLERLASTHLPETLDVYLAARGVENADAMLVDQLSTMERVSAEAAQRSIDAARDRFLVQGSFLTDKYGATHG